mgnify:CR=1 FL=1
MKKTVALILALAMLFALCACGGKSSIKGKWTASDDFDTYTITITDSAFIIQRDNETMSLECSILDDSHLKVSSGGNSDIWTYSVNGDTLTIIANGTTNTCHRIG